MPSWSGFWDNEGGAPYAPLGNSVNKEDAYDKLATLFANRVYSHAAARELIYSLVGGNVGDPASSAHKRVQAAQDLNANVNGGARAIESFLDINRVTTSADITRIQGALRQSSKPTYPVDKSGNGGGSKGGY